MRNLLKADLYRILKNKLFLISLILAAAFPLLMTLMYYGIDKLALLAAQELDEFKKLSDMNLFSSSLLIMSSFSLNNNVGIIIPVFSCIFVGADISSGFLRNKIITGKSRKSIYISHLHTSMLYNVAIIIVYFGSTVLFASLFYGFDDLNALSFIYFTVTGMLTFAFIACISTLLVLTTKSTPAAVILTEVVAIGLSTATTLFDLVDYEKYKYSVYLIPTLSNSAGMLNYTEPPTAMFLEGIVSYALFGLLFTLIGIHFFKKKDIK